LNNIGLLIANSTPGNVSMLPGRGYFRATSTTTPVFTNITAGSVFTTAPQGSFYLAIRGTHNFAGTVDMGALSGRAKPSDPLDSSLTTIPQATLTRGLKKPSAATSSM